MMALGSSIRGGRLRRDREADEVRDDQVEKGWLRGPQAAKHRHARARITAHAPVATNPAVTAARAAGAQRRGRSSTARS